MIPTVAIMVMLFAVAGCCIYISYRVGQAISPTSRLLQRRLARVEAAVGYSLLQRAIIAANGHNSRLATALGRDLKGKLSLATYIVSVPAAFLNPWIAVALYIAVAFMWFVPDRRIEAASYT